VTMRQAAILGGIVGLLVSTSVLILLWYGVSGILAIGNNTDPIDLMYIVWPSALMLTVGWRTTPHGITTTLFSAAINGGMYGILAILLRTGLTKAWTLWKSN
jgi:hypothetical protein